MSIKAEQIYTSEDKLRWEIEKLQAETKNLKRIWISNPASWFTIITTIVALSSVAIQYVNSDKDLILKQIQKDQLKLDLDKMANDSVALSVARQQLQNQILLAQGELAKLKASPTTSDQNNNQFQESEDTFNTLSAALKNDDSSAQFVSVIATYQTSKVAIRNATKLIEAKLNYPAEVYQKTARQYALTLGGKSTYLNASSRVEYAKRNGFPDAVVRFAKNWGDNIVK